MASTVVAAVRSLGGRALRNGLSKIVHGVDLIEAVLGVSPRQPREGVTFTRATTMAKIRDCALGYLESMRMYEDGIFVGYRHSACCSRPVLYATIAALLTKHLLGIEDERIGEEIALVRRHQSPDGLFRDPSIACDAAETLEWWGWEHLTLHALMTLALYDVPAVRKLDHLERLSDADRFRQFLESLDWGNRAAWTSNRVQNIGVMLQYSRDFQGCERSDKLLEVLYDVIESRQDPTTGLWGGTFESPEDLSLGVQAGYHFWLLLFYDQRPMPLADRIIDSVLSTQNLLGGFGVNWNSSACEDIDSIDSLARFSGITQHRMSDVQTALRLALSAVLHNFNEDGGCVFVRHRGFRYGHRQMFSATNQSNVFHTWFRLLGLAYCLSALTAPPPEMAYDFNWTRAPGLQFPLTSRTAPHKSAALEVAGSQATQSHRT